VMAHIGTWFKQRKLPWENYPHLILKLLLISELLIAALAMIVGV